MPPFGPSHGTDTTSLREALDLAHRCGALRLAATAREDLVAAGARPRRLALSGADSLTACERRVAQMGADGMANRQIAQSLFVTVRTVEMHLSHAYVKLGISSRRQLAAALPATPDTAGRSALPDPDERTAIAPKHFQGAATAGDAPWRLSP